MRNSKIKLLLPIVLFIAGSACAAPKQYVKPYAMNDDPAIIALTKSADRIKEGLLVLREKENALTSLTPPPEPSDPALKGEITLRSWNGPALELLNKVGMLTGYKVIELGSPSAIPLIVSVDAVRSPAHWLLQDVGLQISGRGGIFVRESSKEIVLLHTNNI